MKPAAEGDAAGRGDDLMWVVVGDGAREASSRVPWEGRCSAQDLLHQPDVRHACTIYVCSSPAAFSAVLKWPRLADEEALLVHAAACPRRVALGAIR